MKEIKSTVYHHNSADLSFENPDETIGMDYGFGC